MKRIILIFAIIINVILYTNCTPIDFGSISWTEYNPDSSNPVARQGHTLAYMGNSKVLLFGGLSETNYLQDTWEYNLTSNAWTEYNTIGTMPSERVYHSMVYVENSKIILFGGFDGSDYLNDTWEYDVETHTWTEYNTIGTKPIYRSDHSMAYIGNGKLILYGGRYLSGEGKYYYLNDTWEYDIDTHTWTEYDNIEIEPFSRASHSSSYLLDGEIILFGGYVDETGNSSDTWKFNISNQLWSNIELSNSPTKRIKHSMSYFNSTKAVLFGGYGDYSGNIYLNDTWLYDSDLDEWFEFSGLTEEPAERMNHSIIHIDDNTILLFGGKDSDGNLLSDLWIYNYES